MEYRREELLINLIARHFDDCRHICVGVSSPIPGSAALLAQARGGGGAVVNIIGSRNHNAFTTGSQEMFDCAAQGRIDAFTLGGGQIDGEANINLVGIGDYPTLDVRWPGSFGSAFLYYLVPNVVLFRDEHSRRLLVPKVDFISAPGVSPPEHYRVGGPKCLITNMAEFSFDRDERRFRLETVHPGFTADEVFDNTGFDYDQPADAPPSPEPDARTLSLIRGPIAEGIAEIYPRFAETVFGLGA
jgi:glutaconate CoA-transferase subunit B